MTSSLLDQFLHEECGYAQIRQLLLDAMKPAGLMELREIELNRFSVIFNLKNRQVKILDILTVGAEGEVQMTFEEFENALENHPFHHVAPKT
jgi:hypothetical protein